MKKRILKALFSGILFGVLLVLALNLVSLWYPIPSNFIYWMSGSMAVCGSIVFFFPPKSKE